MADEQHPSRPRAPWQPSPTDPTEPTISARALAKARGTVEDFARSYMPLLGLPVDDVLCFADSLYFVAGSLYELDELNERGGDPSQAPAAAALRQFLAGRGLLDDVQATLDVGYRVLGVGTPTHCRVEKATGRRRARGRITALCVPRLRLQVVRLSRPRAARRRPRGPYRQQRNDAVPLRVLPARRDRGRPQGL